MSTIHRVEPGTGGFVGDPKIEREWTFMVYMAGDNNLEDFGRADLSEMKEAGSTSQVAIVAQLDRMQQGATRRYYLRKGTNIENDLAEELSETNTGDPRELVYFLAWAMEKYPAKRYALVLWNHGMGWKEDDVYRLAERTRSHGATPQRSLASLVRSLVSRIRRPPLFASTINTVLARGIAYDDTAKDFLDNAEMKRALSCSLLVSGVERLTLLGFDACLMNMIEVAYQVKDMAEYVVGSQETEPGGGWPYGAVLTALTAKPEMTGQELASMIVDKYMASYGAEDQITQSAFDLSHIGDVVAPLNALCEYALAHQEECELTLGRASRKAQRYTDADYKDLYDFCRLIYENSTALEFKQKAQAVMDAIAPVGVNRFVCAEAHRSLRLDRSRGVSIYFPEHAISPFYQKLDFASDTLWDELIHRLCGA